MRAARTLPLSVTLCALSCGTLASAQSPAPAERLPPSAPLPAAAPSAAGPHVLSFTVSGGVSLGSYEAGTLYFLTESIKRSQGDFELKIATGASAGSANALIALIDSCRPQVDDPTDSLGFQTWIPVGMAQLFDPRRVTAISVLNRAPLERAMGRLARLLRAGLPDTCDVVFGVSVTRKVPAVLPIRDRALNTALDVPRAAEKFIVRMTGRGRSRLPRLRNYVDAYAPLPQPLLPFGEGDDETTHARNLDRLLDLLYASAAFPLAFPPYSLAHCETDPNAANGGPASLTCDRPTRALFIDGGVFDNTPLRLNHRIVQRGLRAGADGSAHWLDPGAVDPAPPPPVRFSYVDPATSAFPPLDRESKADGPPGALGYTLDLASAFVHTTRRRELLALLEENREGSALGQAMGLTQNQLPTISGQLGAFFGFFERDFRELDFYLGMYDGFVSVRLYLPSASPKGIPETRLREQFPVLQLPLRADLPQGLRRFACLLSQVEPEYAGHASACYGDDLRNFRILLQVTFDRLHAACARVKPRDLTPYASPLCRAAARGEPRRLLPGVRFVEPELCVRDDGEPDFNYSLRLLGEYGFAYRDLGLSEDEADYGVIKIRRKLLAMSDALADAQPSALSATLIETAGRAGANQIAYEPPKNWFYLAGGTALEAGASLLPFSWNQSWARLNLALQISRWQSITTPSRLALSFTPLVGPELQLLFLSGPAMQWMFGGRGGYQISVRDSAGFDECTESRALGDSRNCSQFVLQSYLATALLERLRLQLAAEFFPTVAASNFTSRMALQLSFGVQLF